MSKPVVYPVAEQSVLVAAIVALTAWATAKLHLYSNNIVPDQNTLLSAFTELALTGYTAQTVTWSSVFTDVNGVPVSSSGEKIFTQSDATGGNCYGWFLTDSAGTNLLAAGAIDNAPFVFTPAGNALPISLKVDLGGGISAISETP